MIGHDQPYPHTIAIASGKGGVGKSFLALNLAWALAELGQRVLLVELDRDAGALSIAAGLGAPPATAPARDAATLASRAMTVPGNARVQLLRGSDMPPDAARAPARLAPLLSGIAAEWRLIDLAPGIGEQNILWLSRAQQPMLIATPELVTVQAVLRLQQQLQWQHAFGKVRGMDERLAACPPTAGAIKRELKVVFGERSEQVWSEVWKSFRAPQWLFNRVLPDDEAQFARIGAYLRTHAGEQASTPWKIPEDAAQTRCARVGRLLLRHEPACEAAGAIRGVAAALIAENPVTRTAYIGEAATAA
jgi:MinD-like ATPase involved in chromosome partitioning or flagellar assembly